MFLAPCFIQRNGLRRQKEDGNETAARKPPFGFCSDPSAGDRVVLNLLPTPQPGRIKDQAG
jgi:hypothetical protein